MNHPGLDRPRPEARDVAAFSDGDRAVLMPAECPVVRRGLVEQQRSHRLGCRTEMNLRHRADRTMTVEKIDESGYANKTWTGALDRHVCEEAAKLGQDGRGGTAMVLEAALGEH